MEEYIATQTQCGQYRRYGDFFREWDIKTKHSQEETAEWAFQNLYKRRVPYVAEWRRNIMVGGEKHGDMGYYFAGYYKIETVSDGFHFTICEPYAD